MCCGSIDLLSDAIELRRLRCVDGMTPNRDRLEEQLERSLMLVTALAPEIGYDKAAEIAKHAHHNGLTLLEAALALGHVSEARFREIVRPEAMIGPTPAGDAALPTR